MNFKIGVPFVCGAACAVLAFVAVASFVSPEESLHEFTSRALMSDQEEWTKELFTDVKGDILGTVAAFVTVAVASGGGIGGGGLLVPLYILVLQLGRFAIPLSKATIFGSAVSNLIINWPKRHPEADRPLIAFDVTLMLEPMTLAGTIVGVLLNTIFPTWLITLLLIALLGFTTHKTLKKGMTQWAKETAEMERNKNEEDTTNHTTANDEMILLGNTDDNNVDKDAIEKVKQREKSAGFGVIFMLVLCWSSILVAALLKGGHGAKSIVGLECASFAFWSVNVLTFCVLTFVTFVGGRYQNAIWEHKNEIGYSHRQGDVQWDSKNVWYYPMLCTLAGVAAGLLGIGGGMVKGPLMLAMGVRNEVSSATSAFMILFTASATTLQFTVLGMLRWDYTLWYGMVGFTGGFIGKQLIGKLIKQYNRPSLVVFCLGAIIGLSCLVMGIVGFSQIASDLSNEDWEAFHFHNLCSHDD